MALIASERQNARVRPEVSRDGQDLQPKVLEANRTRDALPFDTADAQFQAQSLIATMRLGFAETAGAFGPDVEANGSTIAKGRRSGARL